jgi:hypothetical protein
MRTSKNPDLRASAARIACLPRFIPTDGTTDMTTGHLTNPAKDAGQVIGYSHSTKSPKNGNQVAGYAALRKKFLAYISPICGAAKFFASSRYAVCLLTPFPRLAFGRTLNF